jgi:MOSC domain-containing protein YiiM
VKLPVGEAFLVEDHGVAGDAHAGRGERQVSLLPVEAFDEVRKKGISVSPGDFAENITTKDIDLSSIETGHKIVIGLNVILEVTQVGKECLTPCEISKETGICIMHSKGLFAKVIKGGEIIVGDSIVIIAE